MCFEYFDHKCNCVRTTMEVVGKLLSWDTLLTLKGLDVNRKQWRNMTSSVNV